MPISVTILTKNSAPTLEAALRSVSAFAEVVIGDTGSTDDTLAIAARFPNVRVCTLAFSGFGPAHNTLSALAANDWILSLDSDEELSDDLVQEISSMELDPACLYTIRRDNYFNGKRIRGCSGWYPDRVARLYHRQKTRFSDDAVHEKILAKGLQLVPLRHPMRHTPYRSIGDFLAKMQVYSTLFAEQNRGKKKSSFLTALLHGWHAFFKSFFWKKGFLAGKEGFIISSYQGQTAFYKYLKLSELNQSKDF